MPGDENVQGRLSIPYLTPAGCVSVRYRTLTDGPKYLSQTGDSARLYNVAALHRPSSSLLVTEGELDCIMAEQATGLPTVGVPGAQAWQPHFPLLLEDYERVVVLADGDQAGLDLARKITGALPNAMAVSMPDGLDVSDVVLKEGPAALKARAGL